MTVDSTDPRWAARLANAYAQAFVDWSVANDRARLTAAETVVSAKLKQLKATGQQGTSDYTMLTRRPTGPGDPLGDLDRQLLGGRAGHSAECALAPKPKRSAAIGVVLGLVLGIGFAFLREKLDTRLHDHREVGEIVDLPVIGRVAKIPEEALAKGSLVVVSEADGPRRRVDPRAAQQPAVRLARRGEPGAHGHERAERRGQEPADGQPGRIAGACRQEGRAGRRRPRRPRVHSIFGIRNTRGVSSVIAGFCSLDDALQTYDFESPRAVTIRGQRRRASRGRRRRTATTHAPDCRPPSRPTPARWSPRGASRRSIRELSTRRFDYVLIDSPAFLAVGDAAALAAVADAIVLLVNLKMTNRPTLEEARDFLRPLPPTKLGVVTVMDSVGKSERYHYYAQNA